MVLKATLKRLAQKFGTSLIILEMELHYATAIDMENHQIKGLGDGNENGDAVNVKQLNEVESNAENYTNSEIVKVNNSILV